MVPIILCACAPLPCVFASCPCLRAHAADPAKILRVTFQAAETGFDPVKVSDYYSGTVIEAIFDPLLTYDYLARPAKLVPNTAEALPQVTDDGRTYTFSDQARHLFRRRPGVQGREARADRADYAYSIRRFLDPKNRSPYAFLFEGKIVGLDELARGEEDRPLRLRRAGRRARDPDRYTLRIRLKEPDFNFSHVLAFPLAGAVAREVIEAYGDESAGAPGRHRRRSA